MAKRKKPDHITVKNWDDVDSPPLTDAELANMKPMREVFPDLAEYAAKRKRGQRGPQRAQTKRPVTIRIDRDVLASYKATGPGWQSRMNDALRRGTKSLQPTHPLRLGGNNKLPAARARRSEAARR